MEVVNSQIAGTFKRCAECMMSNIGSHQKRITFLGTNPYPTPSEGTALRRWVFPFPLRWEICDVIVLWKNKSQQQRTLGTRCHGNPDVRTWMWINVLLIEWMVLFGHCLGFFSVGCWCLDYWRKTWEEVGRCGEDVMRKAGFLDGCYFCFFGFWLLHL